VTDKKLNILFLSAWYPNRVIPTDGNFVQKHAEAVALRSNVAALHVCSDPACKESIELTEANIHGIYTVNVYYKKIGHSIPLVSQLQKMFRYLKAHSLGLKMVRKKFPEIDLVHQNILYPVGIVSWYLKKIQKIPYVITEHHTIYLPINKIPIPYFQKQVSKIIARNASVIAPVSENLKNAMIDVGLKAHYEVVYNVVDTKIFHPSNDQHTHQKVKFLHISSLKDSQKNLSGMLRVVAELSKKRNDFECWFIGDGDTTPHIALAKELGIHDTFAFFGGPQTTAEVAETMRNSDCLILFSHYENLPCVIVEAFAAGIPVVSTSVGGIPEIVNEHRGILMAPRDEPAFLSALTQMIDQVKDNRYHPIELAEYADAHFSYEKISEKFHEIYYRILKKDV
jgi:glycosyltransferase involved in cell wall biosynthesis